MFEFNFHETAHLSHIFVSGFRSLKYSKLVLEINKGNNIKRNDDTIRMRQCDKCFVSRNLWFGESENVTVFEEFVDRARRVFPRFSPFCNGVQTSWYIRRLWEIPYLFVGGQRLLTLTTLIRDVATLYVTISVFYCCSAVAASSLLLCHSTWSLASLVWTEQLLKTFHV